MQTANSTIGFLKSNIRSAPPAAKETTYKTFVRPMLENASTSWAPFNDKDSGKIDKVQRRAARFVMNDYRRTSSVTEMLTNLDWDTLQERRDLARLSHVSMMYRIVHGLVDIPAELYLTPSTSNHRFHQIRTSNSTYQQSFFLRTIEPTPSLL